MPRDMQWERTVEFTHEGKDYTAEYIYDADVGKSWITAIWDEDGNEVYPELDTDGWSRQARIVNDQYVTLKPIAERAMENEEQNQAERAAEQALSDGPSESYESIQAKNRLLK